MFLSFTFEPITGRIFSVRGGNMRTERRFGKKVKELRLERGWSQDQLAELADITTRTVQRVEKDQTRDGETLKAIAAAFDVSVKDLATDYWVAEAQSPTALMIESADDFKTVIQRAHHVF
jgi:transcriptional regulator with XRE-family HTH domain